MKIIARLILIIGVLIWLGPAVIGFLLMMLLIWLLVELAGINLQHHKSHPYPLKSDIDYVVFMTRIIMPVFYHLPILGLTLFTAVLLTGCESKAKRDFNAGCQSGGSDRSACSCVYDKLEAHYSPTVMEKMADQNISRLDLPADFGEQMYRAAQA